MCCGMTKWAHDVTCARRRGVRCAGRRGGGECTVHWPGAIEPPLPSRVLPFLSLLSLIPHALTYSLTHSLAHATLAHPRGFLEGTRHETRYTRGDRGANAEAGTCGCIIIIIIYYLLFFVIIVCEKKRVIGYEIPNWIGLIFALCSFVGDGQARPCITVVGIWEYGNTGIRETREAAKAQGWVKYRVVVVDTSWDSIFDINLISIPAGHSSSGSHPLNESRQRRPNADGGRGAWCGGQIAEPFCRSASSTGRRRSRRPHHRDLRWDTRGSSRLGIQNGTR